MQLVALSTCSKKHAPDFLHLKPFRRPFMTTDIAQCTSSREPLFCFGPQFIKLSCAKNAFPGTPHHRIAAEGIGSAKELKDLQSQDRSDQAVAGEKLQRGVWLEGREVSELEQGTGSEAAGIGHGTVEATTSDATSTGQRYGRLLPPDTKIRDFQASPAWHWNADLHLVRRLHSCRYWPLVSLTARDRARGSLVYSCGHPTSGVQPFDRHVNWMLCSNEGSVFCLQRK